MSGETTPGQSVDASADGVVVRRSEHGWQVGDGQAVDLTSAMVLADLLAADLGAPAPSSAGLAGPGGWVPPGEAAGGLGGSSPLANNVGGRR
ncbi:MAG: hypothetical protein ACLQB1_32110 [Streptosporangiaceae bacterium]